MAAADDMNPTIRALAESLAALAPAIKTTTTPVPLQDAPAILATLQPDLPVAPEVGDAVTRPNHYTKWKIEPIYFIIENNLSFVQGNVVKYVMRWEDKDGIQDLKKARRYLDMQIKKLEGDPNYSGKP